MVSDVGEVQRFYLSLHYELKTETADDVYEGECLHAHCTC